MPRRDGSGPSGKGPRTGLGAGSCQGTGGGAPRMASGGRGRGLGRGAGGGGGGGRGRGMRAGSQPGAPAAPNAAATPDSNEVVEPSLEEQVAGLKDDLDAVRTKLDKLLERFPG